MGIKTTRDTRYRHKEGLLGGITGKELAKYIQYLKLLSVRKMSLALEETDALYAVLRQRDAARNYFTFL